MAGLNVLNTETGDEDVASTAAPLTKPVQAKGRYAVASPTGAVPMNESILENMQRLLEQKQAQQGSLVERLKDARAAFTGYGLENAQSIDMRRKAREEEAADIFQMQNAIAQHKAAQAQLAKIRAGDAASGWGPSGTAAPAGGTAAPTVASGFSPEVVEQYNRILDTEGITAANKFKNEQLKIRSQYEFNPQLDQIVKIPVNGRFEDVTLRTAKKIADSNPAVKQYLRDLENQGGIPPSTASTAAPVSAAATPPAVSSAASPATPKAPSAPVAAAPAAPVAPAGQPATQPAPVAGTRRNPSSAELEQQMEIQKQEQLARVKGREKQFEEIGKKAGEQVVYLEKAASNASSDIAGYNKLETLVKNNPRAFGVLQNPDFVSGVLKAVQEGANVGNYNVSLPGVEPLIRQAGGNADDVTAANMAAREFARLQLNAIKLLQGTGSVSDAEQKLLARFSGSASDDPRTIFDMIKWGRARAEYDKEMGQLWKNYLKKNPNGDYRDFYINSPEREKLVQRWEKTTEDMVKDYESIGKKPVSAARAELERRRASKNQ